MTFSRVTFAATLMLVGLQGSCGAQADTRLPLSRPPATEDRIAVPAGFHVSYFARGLGGVRFMTMGPDSAVYASQSEMGRVVRLADATGDGVADSATIVATGLNRPHGLAFHKGWLYIANGDGVVRLRVAPNGRAAGTPERVNSYSGRGGHWTRTIVFGPDSAMYVSVGSSCNLCVEADSDRAAVMRFDEDGRNGRIFSRGLRNAVGIAVEPSTRALWVTQNERDNLRPRHEDLPPEEINILREGGDFGWPYCYGDRIPNPEFNDARRCAATIPPALEMQAHSAPLGITFLREATQFPAAYRGDALVAFHGSWNRDVKTGAKVVRIRVKDGRPVSSEDFATGWQLANGSRWGQPVDVLVYRDGSVLISDDLGGAIFRVSR